jgi:hypothetical protein
MNLLRNNINLIKKWLVEEWAVVAFGLLISVIYVLPYYTGPISLGEGYRGVPLLIQDSEGEYLGQIRELQDGHYSISSSVFYEYKDWPALVPQVGHFIYYLPTLMFGMSVVSGDMLFKFLFPFVLFLLIYIFLKKITGGLRFWSLVGALLVVVGFDLSSVYFIKKLLFGDFTNYFAPWTRPVNPITGMLALALYFIFLYKIFIGESKRFLLPGFLMGFMIGYFFSFVYAGVFTVFLTIISLIFQRSGEKIFKFLLVLLTGAITVIVLSGTLVWDLFFNKSVGGLNDPQLSGLFYTHLPLFNKTSLLLIFIFLGVTYFVYRKFKEKIWQEDWWLFSIAILVTNQAVYNIQVVLGWTVWPAHFAQYTNVGVSLVLIIILARLDSKFSLKATKIMGCVLILLLSLILLRSITSADYFKPTLEKAQTYRPIFNWLDSNAGNDCVVFVVQDYDSSRMDLNRFLSGFTGCDLYHSYNIYQGVPRERVFHNLLSWMWIMGVRPEEAESFLQKNEFFVRIMLFRNWRDMFCCQGDKWVRDTGSVEEWENWRQEAIKKVHFAYLDFLKKDVRKELGKYRLDYVVVERMSVGRKDFDRIKWLKKVYSDDYFDIYHFEK